MAELDLDASVIASGKNYKKEVMTMIMLGLDRALEHMTLIKGLRGKQSVGTLRSNSEVRPYRTAKDAKDTTSIRMREIETFHGEVLEEFDAHQLFTTIYGEPVGGRRIDQKIVKSIVVAASASIGEKLLYAMFTAKRNASGNTTMDLFNGFDTIIETEKAKRTIAGDDQSPFVISAAQGNLFTMDKLTTANVGDELKKFYLSSHDVLKDRPTKMFVPFWVKEMYDAWHAANFGTANFASNKYEQNILLGTSNMCTLVPMVGMKTAKNIFISSKKDMLVGTDQISDLERFKIKEADNPKVVQLFLEIFFGVEFQSVDQRDFNVAPLI